MLRELVSNVRACMRARPELQEPILDVLERAVRDIATGEAEWRACALARRELIDLSEDGLVRMKVES